MSVPLHTRKERDQRFRGAVPCGLMQQQLAWQHQGYDAATGWGTLDVANFLSAAKAMGSPTNP